MNQNPYKEKENKRTGVIVSIAVHSFIVVFCLLGLVSCWDAPGPPWPNGIGVVVDFGNDDTGSSDVVNESEQIVDEPVEEALEETSESTEEVVQEVETTEVVESIADPVVENSGNVNLPSEETTQSTSTNQEVIEEKETEELFGGQNNGDGQEAGDQGNPESVVDAPLFDGEGTGGGNEGNASASIAGWKWEREPQIKGIPDGGIVKLKFVVNDLGKVISVEVLESPYAGMDDEFIKELKSLKFERTTFNGKTPARTSGTVTFKFKGR